MHKYPPPGQLCCITVWNLLAAGVMFLMAPWGPAVGVGFTALCLLVAWPRPDTPENAALLRTNIWGLQGLVATLFVVSVIMVLASFTPDGSEELDDAIAVAGVCDTLALASCILTAVKPPLAAEAAQRVAVRERRAARRAARAGAGRPGAARAGVGGAGSAGPPDPEAAV